MTKLLTFFTCIVFTATAYTQNINFNWVQPLVRATGLPFDESYFIGSDAKKNVYVAGNFHFTIDLDPGPGISNVTSNFDNVFIVKLDASGNFVWGRHLGKNDKYTVCKGLSVDTAGNVYTTGYFNGKADFDPGAGVFNLVSGGDVNNQSNDIFISKLNTDGIFQWAKQIGADGIDIGTSINADAFGNVYTTGYFSGIADFDPGPGIVNKGSNNVVSCFISKLDATGEFRYAQVFEGNHNAAGIFIKTDAAGNVYTSGYFDGEVDFDPGSGIKKFTTDLFEQKNFLSKLDSAGNYVWAIRDITGLDIATDKYGNVYTYNIELTKYDLNGNLVWQKPMGGTPNSTLAHDAIKTDGFGNIYITGRFRYTQDFDPGAGVFNLTTTGASYASDVFVCKLDADGSFIWAKAFGGTLEDYATSIAVDDAENVYTTGVFFSDVDFDPGTGTYKLSAAPGGSIFVHKMSPCKIIPPVILQITDCKSYTLNNITYSSSGTYTQVLTSSAGCDSVIQLNLQIINPSASIQVTACDSYLFHEKFLTTAGLYTDTIKTIDGCDSVVHLNLFITKSATTVNAVICSGQSYGGHTTSGTFTDTFHTANGCDSLVTVRLSVLAKPAPDLGSDIELCLGDSAVLVPGNYPSYLWNDGSVLPAYTVKKAGLYAVKVTNVCGEGYDEVRVIESACKMYFPNAFTPNSDGKNDRFALLHPHPVSDFRLSVYNRYGQLVFQTKDYLAGWTGRYKGEAALHGIYVWYCTFKEAGVETKLKGTVLLLR